MPAITALGRLEQKESKFKASLGYNSETLERKTKTGMS
jgi:hypothetical protein